MSLFCDIGAARATEFDKCSIIADVVCTTLIVGSIFRPDTGRNLNIKSGEFSLLINQCYVVLPLLGCATKYNNAPVVIWGVSQFTKKLRVRQH